MRLPNLIGLSCHWTTSLLMIAVLSSNLMAQTDYMTVENAEKKLLKLYERAAELDDDHAPADALERINKALGIEPSFIDALMLKSDLLYDLGDLNGSVASLSAAVELDSTYHVQNLFTLSRRYDLVDQFGASARCLRSYLRHANIDPDERSKIREKYLELEFKADLLAHPVTFDLRPVEGGVNTEYSEALPAFTVDGQHMIFTRKVGRSEDLYISEWNADARAWSPGVPMEEINTPLNEGAHSVSADGKVIAFTSCNRRDGLGRCDLYTIDKLDDGRWSRAQNAVELNSQAWDGHPALTADGRGIYFSSDRGGGCGGMDIWYAHRRKDGRWSEPVNIGDVVNTDGNEGSPYLHFDDRTLYFMSDGHRGLGDFDLFVTKKENTGWTSPCNLGYPINSPGQEGALSIHPDGIQAFYTRRIENVPRPHTDIFTFELDPRLRPSPVSYLNGKVIDASSDAPLTARVEVYNLSDTSETYTYTSDLQGSFKAVLAHGARYGLHVSADGYALYSDQFSLNATDPFSKLDMVISLEPVAHTSATEESSPITLHNILFETGSAKLLPSSHRELNALYDLLSRYASLAIEIRGHTDSIGTVSDNLMLSEERAKAVFGWLVDRGIEAERLRYRGLGESQPLATNDTHEGRALNRRTEFVILRGPRD